jgi:hypothetical protein
MTVELLRRQWEQSGERMAKRMEGLDDDEFFWEPASDCWTVRPDPDAPGAWRIDYDWSTPAQPPLTTIAWRLVHLANGNWIYWEHAFGPGKRMFPDLVLPAGAKNAIRDWQRSREPITEWLSKATDEMLDEPRPSHLGAPKSAGDVVAILIDEQTHHGAEIALMRDLYVRLG